MREDPTLLLEYIRAPVRDGRFYVTTHALTSHPVREGFTLDDALEALANGSVIEHRASDARCVVVGVAESLGREPEYHGNAIHLVCQYDEIERVVIITMYRPRRDEWSSPFRRRPMR